jgi:hypothetical protein
VAVAPSIIIAQSPRTVVIDAVLAWVWCREAASNPAKGADDLV